MRNCYLIAKKELQSYFTSPVAYVVITIFLIITGYFFYNLFASFSTLSFQASANPALAKQRNLLNVTETVIRPLFGNMSIIMLLMMPLLTMRLFSEEKKSGTIELLLTYPISDMEVIIGKFVACTTVFILMLSASITCPILVMVFGEPETGPIITGYLGLFLMGSAFISLGIFTSSITENQIVAATLSFGVLFLFWMMGYSVSFMGPTLGRIIMSISLIGHIEGFAKGVIDTTDIIYYLIFSSLFIFLTLRVMESKKWRG
ncbi:MAG: ABC transporter permease subunit [Proteobacteria bacterium]|nr:ABC transporter permease subunit [Pseudomonadota bacterium]